jgi:hypothetical protein
LGVRTSGKFEIYAGADQTVVNVGSLGNGSANERKRAALLHVGPDVEIFDLRGPILRKRDLAAGADRPTDIGRRSAKRQKGTQRARYRCVTNQSEQRLINSDSGHFSKSTRCPIRATERHRFNYSITSSARLSNDVGMVRPSIRAVCALMDGSNLFACTIGNSPGLFL